MVAGPKRLYLAMTRCTVVAETPVCRAISSALRGATRALEIIHKCWRTHARLSVFMRSLTSSTDRCEAARVIRCPMYHVHSFHIVFSFILPHRKGFGIRSRFLSLRIVRVLDCFGLDVRS